MYRVYNIYIGCMCPCMELGRTSDYFSSHMQSQGIASNINKSPILLCMYVQSTTTMLLVICVVCYIIIIIMVYSLQWFGNSGMI